MLVLLLLGASVCGGFSYVKGEYYGSTFRISLNINIYSIEFKATHDSKVTVLWNRENSTASSNRRQRVTASHFVIRNVTQRDSGLYIMRDKDQKEQFMKTLKVTEKNSSYKLNAGEKFSFTSDLEPKSCNIYFFSTNDDELRGPQIRIVHQGKMQYSWTEFVCKGFDVIEPCGLSFEAIPMSCNGLFQFRDQNDDKALVAELEIEQTRNDAPYFYIGVGSLIAALLLCCCCVRRCCCRKKSSEKADSATAAGPAVNFHEYGSEHPGPGPDQSSQPSATLYPSLPSYTPTNPLVHNPPRVNMPNTYSEMAAPAEIEYAPTVPLGSDTEERFELKGIPSAMPLSSASTHCDVYTSDKLNFL
ncbi:hypothetical protein Q5P01_009017 [Channa striata]|uniref:Uncharacterized protein n=1 Tax=Channa striata TaxID=64152 RepID=A0AA88SUL1_CHASR|nr:hypothetical protein Q5P01_009017 [Channa striata]